MIEQASSVERLALLVLASLHDVESRRSQPLDEVPKQQRVSSKLRSVADDVRSLGSGRRIGTMLDSQRVVVWLIERTEVPTLNALHFCTPLRHSLLFEDSGLHIRTISAFVGGIHLTNDLVCPRLTTATPP